MELKKHAKHNKKACIHLHEKGEFPDWVITTAYYSASKLVEGTLFPYKIGEKEYKNFATFFNDVCLNNIPTHSVSQYPKKHDELLKLVKSEFPDIFNEYNWLYATCMNARYNTGFGINANSKKLAQLAVDYLTKIETEINNS